jgi:hypothetical protein
MVGFDRKRERRVRERGWGKQLQKQHRILQTQEC